MTSAHAPSVDSEMTWLLHRAAQRMRVATGKQAEQHGLQLRDYIVLSALRKTPSCTQIELAKILGLDKTTLMSQLDQLERSGLLIRRPDPRDRRARIPEITPAGNDARAGRESQRGRGTRRPGRLRRSTGDYVRQMLFRIIGDTQDPGSCL